MQESLISKHYPNMNESSPSEEVVIEYKDVSKSFRAGGRLVKALRRVTFKVFQGVVTGLIGPDGAGKTTLMRLAAGLLAPDEGEITVLAMDSVRQSLSIQAAIGYMPQRFGLYEDLTVEENLDLYADLQGVPKEARPDRYKELMHMTGLGGFTSRLAGRLSGGMKQKLGLACTLVRSPRLLLLDEPTVGVDPVSRRELWSIVYRLVHDEGMSVLLSTAYLDEAERCNEVVILHEGELLDYDSPQIFSERMEGRTYAVTVPGMKKREIQEKLAGSPDVTDALIQGEWVRLVMDTQEPTGAEKVLSGMERASLQPVPPRFEDSFMAMLRSKEPHKTRPPGIRKISASHSRAESSSGAVIEVKEVKRRFGDFYAVKGITFEVSRGEIFGLLGANGAGKSTTFRMLCGLLPASAGALRVSGVDLRRAAGTARARIGYMSQKFSLYGNLSIGENLRFFSSAYGLSGRRRHERITWALEQFELLPWADARSMDLPLGYKQRLALACALMHEPDILFLDEPTSGVDPLARREFWHRINALAEQKVTVLVTTHFMEEAEYCDRLAIMAAGEILALGSPADIKARVRTPGKPEPTMEDAFINLIETREGNGSDAH
jgi:ABC-2 type transport system ATP-binding protein